MKGVKSNIHIQFLKLFFFKLQKKKKGKSKRNKWKESAGSFKSLCKGIEELKAHVKMEELKTCVDYTVFQTNRT